jgi:hypothetical protein
LERRRESTRAFSLEGAESALIQLETNRASPEREV